MTTDELISMAKACEDLINDEHKFYGVSPEEAIATLRRSVRTLATVQRDLIRGLLSPGV